LEQFQHKIITFLTRNAHLDVEIPDIAFHLKLDEKLVQSTLDSLLEKGIVSVQQNQYGRTYWYYVPQRSSIPFETMSAKVPDEVPESIENKPEKKRTTFTLFALIFSIITTFLAVGAVFWVSKSLNVKVASISEGNRENVTKNELTTVVESAEARIGRIEIELKKTMVKVDSLKRIVMELDKSNQPKSIHKKK
jgi:predicted transcriptional regulator